MKYLLLLVVLMVAWHFWRSGRVSGGTAAPPPQRKLGPPESMVHCAACQVLVPRSDAVASGGKLYRSRQHAAAGTGAPDKPAP